MRCISRHHVFEKNTCYHFEKKNLYRIFEWYINNIASEFIFEILDIQVLLIIRYIHIYWFFVRNQCLKAKQHTNQVNILYSYFLTEMFPKRKLLTAKGKRKCKMHLFAITIHAWFVSFKKSFKHDSIAFLVLLFYCYCCFCGFCSIIKSMIICISFP